MIYKVRVINTISPDIKGQAILSDIHSLGYKEIIKVTSIKVYRLEGISASDAKILAEKLLSEPIDQTYVINRTILNPRIPLIEIAYKKGVMNPEVASIEKSARDLNINLIAADSSWEYAFFGKVSKDKVLKVVEKLNRYNPLIEYIVEQDPESLKIFGRQGEAKTILIRGMSDEKLMELSKDTLFLNLDEMKAIKKYFQKLGRDPIDVELETLAQTWSEHSGHKTFKSEILVDGKKKPSLIHRIRQEALKHSKNIVSAFVDNSGVMDFYEGWAICGKVETHNSPSAIEPYGGAMTGSGGVFRDIAATGQGAKNIASTDIFCFAPLDFPKKDLPDGCLPPDYLLKRVVAGVRDYGNRVGIPTNNGSVHFHKDFRAKPSVIVGAYGILPKKYAKKGKPHRGDYIICIGGRTGRDGIHGATFSSGEMTERTISVNSTAVQIGNAIEEKRMLDAILEARDEDLIRVVQDVGGGGFSSAIGEIGEELGVSVDIKNVPLKYQGLNPWEIWVSESQERMIVVIDPKDFEKFEKICRKNNVKYALLGEFDGSKNLRVFYGEEQICNLDMEFLHHGLPKKVLVAKNTYSLNEVRSYHKDNNIFKESSRYARTINVPTSETEWISVLEKVLANGNVCSKEPIIRPYDHSVQGTNDLQPYSGVNLDGPNDSPVLRPLLDKPYGVIISHGLNPILNNIDPYWGSMWAGVEALSNFVAVGGDYTQASLINNYIWPFPDEMSLWSLDRSVDAVVDFMKIFKIPVISGKDSLSSTYRSGSKVIKIPPTLCMSVFGRIADTSKTASSDFKKLGSVICLVGKLDNNLGGSVYYQVIANAHLRGETEDLPGSHLGGVPKVDLKLLPKIFSAIHDAIKKGQALSVHDVSEGGVITAIFEMCVGGGCGAVISTSEVKLGFSQDHTSEVSSIGDFLFNETAGCFIVEVENESVARKLFKDIPYKIIGKTISEEKLGVTGLFTASINKLKVEWQKPMKELFP